MIAMIVAGFGVFVVVLFGAQAWWEQRRQQNAAPSSAARSSAASSGLGSGRCPFPTARILIMPGVLIVDLRLLPSADLKVASFGVVREQLRLEEPAAAYVFVVDEDTARGWAELEPAVRGIVAGRLREAMKASAGQAFLYVAGASLDEAHTAALDSSGLNIVRSLQNLGGERPLSMDDLLGQLGALAPASKEPARPVMGCTWSGEPRLSGSDIAVKIGELVFVDLRRAHPASVGNLHVFDVVRDAFRRLGGKHGFVVWVISPWIVRRWGPRRAEAIAALRDCASAVSANEGHRLMLYGEEGWEPDVISDLAKLGFGSVGEKMFMRTPADSFEVPMFDVLTDVELREGVAS